MNDSVILTSGRSTPAQAETVQRGEGVALVLWLFCRGVMRKQ